MPESQTAAPMRIQRAASAPWDERNGIPPAFAASPQTSLAAAKPVRTLRAPLRVRAGAPLDVLADDPASMAAGGAAVYRLAGSKRLRKIPIGKPASDARDWRILDFASDPQGSLYVAELFRAGGAQQSAVRKLSPEGAALWARPAPPGGVFRHLLRDGRGNLYTARLNGRAMVERIDPRNGELSPYAQLGEIAGGIFMDGQGRLHYARYLPESSTRGWVRYDPSSGDETVTPADSSLYGHMAHPLGIDDRGRAYAASGMSVACIGPRGSAEWVLTVENIVVDQPGGVFYTSASGAGVVTVTRQVFGDRTVSRVPLAIPKDVAAGGGGWRLISVDAQGRFYVYGGESPEADGVLLRYSPDGSLERRETPPADLTRMEHRLEPPGFWSVDPEGRIYLPVLSPEQFVVLELTHD